MTKLHMLKAEHNTGNPVGSVVPAAAVVPGPPSSSSSAAARTPLLQLDDGKAGMTGLDKAEIERIINEASAGSSFYERERQKATNRKDIIHRMLEKNRVFEAARCVPSRDGLARVSALERKIEAERVLGTFVHLDMDMFFAAVAERDDPSLKHIPFAVGGMGMLCTSNYEARRFGVRAGMPGFVARKLCPQLVFVNPDGSLYQEAAEIVRGIAAEYDPTFASGGLDELCMNLGPYLSDLAARTDSSLWAAEASPLQHDGAAALSRHRSPRACSGDEELAAVKADTKQQEASGGVSSAAARADPTPGNDLRLPAGHESGGSVVPAWWDLSSRDPPPQLRAYLAAEVAAKRAAALTSGVVPTAAEAAAQAINGALSASPGAAPPTSLAAVVTRHIRRRIQHATRLTASAGIGPTPIISKMCSNYDKPDGQFELRACTADDVKRFVAPLGVRQLPGVGKVLEQLLANLNVKTCGDVVREKHRLCFVMTPKTYDFILAASLGASKSWSEHAQESHSIGRERTFAPLRSAAQFDRVIDKVFDTAYNDLLDEGEGTYQGRFGASSGGTPAQRAAPITKRDVMMGSGASDDDGPTPAGPPLLAPYRGTAQGVEFNDKREEAMDSAATTSATVSCEEASAAMKRRGRRSDFLPLAGEGALREVSESDDDEPTPSKSSATATTSVQGDVGSPLSPPSTQNSRAVRTPSPTKTPTTSLLVLKAKRRSFVVKQYSLRLKQPTNDRRTLRQAFAELARPIRRLFGEFRLLGVRFCEIGPPLRRGGAADAAAAATVSGGSDESRQLTLSQLVHRRTAQEFPGAVLGLRRRRPRSWLLAGQVTQTAFNSKPRRPTDVVCIDAEGSPCDSEGHRSDTSSGIVSDDDDDDDSDALLMAPSDDEGDGDGDEPLVVVPNGWRRPPATTVTSVAEGPIDVDGFSQRLPGCHDAAAAGQMARRRRHGTVAGAPPHEGEEILADMDAAASSNVLSVATHAPRTSRRGGAGGNGNRSCLVVASATRAVEVLVVED